VFTISVDDDGLTDLDLAHTRVHVWYRGSAVDTSTLIVFVRANGPLEDPPLLSSMVPVVPGRTLVAYLISNKGIVGDRDFQRTGK